MTRREIVHEYGMTRNQIYYENAVDKLQGYRLIRTPSVGMFFEDGGAQLSGTSVHLFDGPGISFAASQVEGQMGIFYKAQDGTVTTDQKLILPESAENTDTESIQLEWDESSFRDSLSKNFLYPAPMSLISAVSYWISQMFKSD